MNWVVGIRFDDRVEGPGSWSLWYAVSEAEHEIAHQVTDYLNPHLDGRPIPAFGKFARQWGQSISQDQL